MSNRPPHVFDERVGGAGDGHGVRAILFLRAVHLITMGLNARIAQMKRVLWYAAALTLTTILISIAYISLRIARQSARDEARPADIILVLGAAEYRGRPSPVLKARLDHALELYQKGLAPRIMTTGGAG